MMNAILKGVATFVTGITAVFGVSPALAAMNPNGAVDSSIKAAITADAPSVSDLAKIEAQEDADQAEIDALTSQNAAANCGWDCIDKKLQALGDKMTTNRIEALTTEKTAIDAKVGITDDQRAPLDAKLRANIDEMTALKAKIDADTKHTDLVADVESITVDYREYMLVIPQIALEASADHKDNVYVQLSADVVTLQGKIDHMSNAADKARAQAKLDDMKAKIADAKTNADAAYNGIVNLVPDQGVAEHRKANKAALDLATTELTTAHQDYAAARDDEGAINALLGNGSSVTGGDNGHTIMKVNPGSSISAAAHAIVPVHPIANPIMKVSPVHPAISTHANVSATAAVR
jgi:hypothetical protein